MGCVLCWFYPQQVGKSHSFYHLCYVRSLPLAFVQTCSPSLPHVQAAGAICPPAPGTGRAQRSHTAQSHTSSPRAHRSQPDRWTLLGLGLRRPAWNLMERTVNKSWFQLFSPCCVFNRQFMTAIEPPFSLLSCLREPRSGSLSPHPLAC